MNVCPYCGHDFRVQPQGPVRESLSGGVRVLLYIVSFLVPVVGIILGIVFMVRPDPEYKRVGKICLILGVVAIVVEIGFAALLYVMVLGFPVDDSSTPYVMLAKSRVTDGWRFTLAAVSSEVAWGEVTILVVTLDGVASWSPSTSDLVGGTAATWDYGSEELGALSVTLSVTDYAGNGRLDMNDIIVLTASPAFDDAVDYEFRLVHEPSDGLMGQLTFTG